MIVGLGLGTPVQDFIISVGKPKPADPVLGVGSGAILSVFPPAPPPSIEYTAPSGLGVRPGLHVVENPCIGETGGEFPIPESEALGLAPPTTPPPPDPPFVCDPHEPTHPAVIYAAPPPADVIVEKVESTPLPGL